MDFLNLSVIGELLLLWTRCSFARWLAAGLFLDFRSFHNGFGSPGRFEEGGRSARGASSESTEKLKPEVSRIA